jgi:hypothetical protein
MFALRTKLFALLALGIAAGAVLSASPASAAPPSYSSVVANYSHSNSGYGYGYSGGYVDCPAGQLAIASGAVSSDLHTSLLSSLTTPAHTGAFASAWGPSDATLQVKAQCVDAVKVSGTTGASNRTHDSRGGFNYYVRKATCPTGTVAYGGGGTIYNGSVYDMQGIYAYASRPDDASWTYAGAGDLFGRVLAVETHCLPRAKLGRITTVEQTVTTPAAQGRQPVFAGARCPAGFSAFAGGAWYHTTTTSSTPSWLGYLRVSEMTADGRGWFAGGDSFTPSMELTTKVRCTDRLG